MEGVIIEALSWIKKAYKDEVKGVIAS